MAARNKIMVINAGSSSLKYKLFEKADGALKAVASGVCERIGDPDGVSYLRVRRRAQEGGAGQPAAAAAAAWRRLAGRHVSRRALQQSCCSDAAMMID